MSRPAPGDEPTVAVAPARAPLDELDETTRPRVAAHPRPEPVDELDETTRPRVAVTPRAEAVDDDTVRREAPDDSGDTRAGTRRARRSAAAAAAAGAMRMRMPWRPAPVSIRLGLPEATRDARVPVALEREIYRPRADAPVRVERSAPRPSAPPDRDAAAVRPRTTRRAAWRALLVGVAVVVVLAAVAVTAIVLWAERAASGPSTAARPAHVCPTSGERVSLSGCAFTRAVRRAFGRVVRINARTISGIDLRTGRPHGISTTTASDHSVARWITREPDTSRIAR